MMVKQRCVEKILLAIRETFLYKNDCNFNYYKLSYKLAFIPFLSFRINQKQDQLFRKPVVC